MSERRGSMTAYEAMLNAQEPIDRPRIVELIDRFRKTNDEQARNLIVLANIRFATTIAKEFIGHGVDYHDLVMEGALGILRATELFDASMNTTFATYAGYWIKQKIRHAIAMHRQNIRVPRYAYDGVPRMNEAINAFLGENASSPTEEDLAQILGIPARKVRRILQGKTVSGTARYEAAKERAEKKADERPTAPESMIAGEQAEKLDRIIGNLRAIGIDERDGQVFRMRYGIGSPDGEGKTLREVGEAFLLTRERVRQICDLVRIKIRMQFPEEE